MSELRLLKFQTCANSTTDQWKIYPVYQMAQVHPSPLIAMKQKKNTKKTKEKQQKQQRPQQWKKYEKDKGWDFFLGKYRSFDGNLFFLFSLEPMLFQIKKLVLLCALQIKPTLSTPDFQPLFGMWKYVYSSAECLKDLSLFFFFKNKITFRYLLQTPGYCSFNSFGPNTTIKKSLGPNFHWSIRNKSVLKYTSMRTNTS